MARMGKPGTRNLWFFFAIAYAITWTFAIPQALLTPPGTEPRLFDITQLGEPGPTIAAFIMVYRDGR